MARQGMDPAVVAGLQRALIGLAGTAAISDDGGAYFEELVEAIIDHTLLNLDLAMGNDPAKRRELVMKALRTIGFDYSADAIRDYVPPAVPKTSGPDIG